jgi:hypothetical protein
VTQAVPSITASGSARVSAKVPFAATTTVTGANVGDIVIVGQPTVALTGLLSLEGIVTAADTVQLYATEVPNTGVTGASKTFEVIVVDVLADRSVDAALLRREGSQGGGDGGVQGGHS